MHRAKKRRTEGPSLDDEIPIWEFIYDIICNMELQDKVNEELFRQYREENPTVQWTVQQLFDYFNDHMRSTLYKCDLPGYKILSLYKSLEIEISEHTETILEMRFSAVLRVNSDRVLEHFSFLKSASQPNPHDFPKSSEPNSNSSKRHQPMSPEEPEFVFTDDFEEKVWKYINRHDSEVSGRSIMSREFWEKMIDRNPSIPVKSPLVLLNHFRNKMIGKMLRQPLCPKLKLRLYKKLRIPMEATEKEWFLRHERIEISVSAYGILKDWKTASREDRWDDSDDPLEAQAPSTVPWIPRGFSVPRDSRSPSPLDAPRSAPPTSSRSRQEVRPSSSSRARRVVVASTPLEVYAPREKPKRVPFFLTDQIHAWNYIYEKMKRAEQLKLDPVLPKGKVFWEDYVRNTNTTKNAGNWSSHFRKQMCPTLQEMPFKREKMLFLYKNIDIEVDEKVHKILQRKCNAKIQLSSIRNVASWKFLDVHEEEEEDPNDSEDPENPQNPQAPEGEEEVEEEEENPVDPVEEEDDFVEEVNPGIQEEEDEESSSCDTTLPLDSEELEIQQEEEREEERDFEAPPYENPNEGPPQCEVLHVVQRAMDEFGDDAIDRMEESVKAAFEEGSQEEGMLNADGIRELVVETVKSSELDENEKTRILSHVDHLTAKILENLGIIEERNVFEVSAHLLKTSLEAKLREMTKKQGSSTMNQNTYVY